MFKLKYILLFVFLTSCSTEHPVNFDVSVSDSDILKTLNIENTNNKITNTWYYIFEDKTLNTLLLKAIKNNLSIKQAQERLKQARYSYMIETKSFLPNIEAMGEYNFNKTNNKNFSFNEENLFKVGFDASWEIDIWGKNDFIKEQYKEITNKARFNLWDLKVSIIAEVIDNYISLREAEKKLNITKKNITLQKDILNTVKDKYSAGIEDELALKQAEFSLEKTKQTSPSLKIQIENSKNRIALLLGILPYELEKMLNTEKNITSKAFKYSVKELHKLPLSIIQTRPDIRIAETNLKTQNALVNQAIIETFPSISLQSSFGFISGSGRKLIGRDKQTYGYTPSITIPIWNWGELKNNIELQKHIEKEYMLLYNEAIISAVLELKDAIFEVEKTFEINSYLKNSLAEMRTIFELTKSKYLNGIIDFTDLATAEQNLLDAENQYIQSNADIYRKITSFYKATGGGYNFIQ